MTADAVKSPSHHYVTACPPGSRSQPREHDVYMRDYEPSSRGPPARDGYESQYDQRYGASPGVDAFRAHRPEETDPYTDRRYRERDAYRRDSPDYESAPIYRERDGHRMNTPAHERDELGRDVRIYPSSRHDRSMSSDRRDTSRRPSPTNSRSRRSRVSREKRQPRRSHGGDFLAQPDNPNAIAVGERSARSMGNAVPCSSDATHVPPPRFASVHTHNGTPLRRDDDSVHLDILPAAPADRFPARGNEIENVDTQASHQIDTQAYTKSLPLTDLPPNIHPSRRAVMTREVSVEDGGSRQSANMGAPRKQITNVAQSIGPSEETLPAFLRSGNNANAVPLGPGKRMRF